MKNIIKTFGLLALITTVSGAFAATSRVSMVNKASPRLPSIAGHIVSASNTTTTTTTTVSSGTTGASYYDNTECIDKYTECIKADDVCGSDMSECTTNVLFHGKMANCLSVLYQCQPSGIQALFGTNNISALACKKGANDVITECPYPKAGSVLDQLITGAAISNRFNTEQCVKSYTRCLKRDEVCGGDFELCTDGKSFKKQAVLCDSTLQRCQSEGKKQLFGTEANANTILISDSDTITIGGRIEQLIKDGASLAAMNAVNTCKKVTDNCLIGACAKNPLRCVEGIKLETINQANIIASGDTETRQNNIVNTDPNNPDWSRELTTSTTIQKWLKSQCLETIGGNQYCHITYREKTPSKKDLVDIDLQEDVFALAYDARKDAVNTKIQDAVKKFDTRAKDACYETIKSCAMRSCGGGLGSVCYQQAKSNNQTDRSGLPVLAIGDVHVNGAPYNEIKSGCSAIVNADANCIYAASASSDDGYTYTYYDDGNSTFNALFPQFDVSLNDPIGAVGKLNALLANSYNDAAIENMKKQCQNVALSCVKSMCGKDYINCYRNRTDIVSGSYETNTTLDKSMNKMGGILDYNIVMGLCMSNVKSSSVCEEHLKIATIGITETGNTWTDASGNKYGSVRDAWLGANTTTATFEAQGYRVLGCTGTEAQARANTECDTYTVAQCDTVDENGCRYTVEKRQEIGEYRLENGAKTLFQTLLADVEKEAQAKYNAKLTKEQNVCRNNNNGGLMGTGDTGSTFMWAKLKSSKIPKNYATQGLKTKEFTPSNDLYGSFCRVKVTIQSDDKYIQDSLGEAATAYFAVGDAFTCGSWINQETLKNISINVGDDARKAAGEDSDKDKWTRTWATVAPGLAGLVGGGVLADNWQRKGASLGGLLDGDGISATKDKNSAAENCLSKADEARSKYYESIGETDTATQNKKFASAVSSANKAKSEARKAGVDVSGIQFVSKGAYTASYAGTFDWNQDLKSNVIKIADKNANTESNSSSEDYEDVHASLVSARKVRTYLLSPEKQPQSLNVPNTLLEQLTELQGNCDKTPIACDNFSYSSNNIIVSKGDAKDAEEIKDYGKASEYFAENLQKLENECGKVSQDKSKSKLGTTIAGAAIGGLGLGFLGNRIAWSAQQTAYEEAENAAIKEWMNDVGNHIQCYVGAEEVGTYGDVISIEID